MSVVETCRVCQDNYHDHVINKSNNRQNRYLQYLGFCSNDCWNKLNKKGKTYCFTYSDLYGDLLKKDKIKVNKKHLSLGA
tara:strand:- start:190 stop:429 length:240 start_codon:yes stop_codon:yes gene_type:complete